MTYQSMKGQFGTRPAGAKAPLPARLTKHPRGGAHPWARPQPVPKVAPALPGAVSGFGCLADHAIPGRTLPGRSMPGLFMPGRTLPGRLMPRSEVSGLGAAPAPVPSVTGNPQLDASLQAAIASAAAPQAPPADAKVLAPGLFLDLHNGNIWYNDMKIPIVGGLISAVAIKLIMFGGAWASKKAKVSFFGSKP
jgi:hypothetical protein